MKVRLEINEETTLKIIFSTFSEILDFYRNNDLSFYQNKARTTQNMP